MPASFIRLLKSLRRRHRDARVWLLALGCVIVLAACAGGSGSSGFDVTAENLAIDTALETNGCTVNDGLTICPSGMGMPVPSASATATATMVAPQLTATAPEARTATPTGTPPADETASATPTVRLTDTPTRTATSPPTSTPTSTPIPAPQVLTNLSDLPAVPCSADGPTAPCLFEFTFLPQGFAATTTYAVAFRMRNPDSDWQIVTPIGFTATIPVAPGGQYQFAVLVFVGGDGRAAPNVDALGQTDANFAFVTPVLATEEL